MQPIGIANIHKNIPSHKNIWDIGVALTFLGFLIFLP